MNTCLLRRAFPIAVVCSATAAFSQNLVAPTPSSGGTTNIYCQVTPDGRVVYSDKLIKGARLDHTITVEPSIEGNSWTTEYGSRPIARQQVERTPIRKTDSLPASGNRKSLDEATSDVIRAEMLLEDARKRQQAGVEPLPGERTGNKGGGSRLNGMYWTRQELLARDVADAEAMLKEAAASRNRLR
jgi:hypothetical protein